MADEPYQDKRFDVLLGAVKAFNAESDASPRIICTASSDEIDLGLDRFMRPALEQMRAAFPGQTIFLNHKYSIPEDVFGVVTSAEIIERNGHLDLDLEIAVDQHNPRAVMVFQQILAGAKLGVSVGVLVHAASVSDEVINGQKCKVLNIKSVTTLEASIVGIPANRRSWVQGALKAASFYFDGEQRSLLDMLMASFDAPEERGDTIMEIEPTEALTSNATDTVAPTFSNADASISSPVVNTILAEPAEVAPVEDSVTVVVVQVDDDDEEDDTEPDPSDPAESPMMQNSRAQTIAELRPYYVDQNRQWFTIKEAPTAEPDSVAEVMIYDAIGSGISAEEFVNQLNGIKASRINVRLNSPGGVIDDGIAIKNALARHPADVYTFVDGIAASMASVIAMVGKEVVMEPDSMLMIHEPWGCAMGNTHDMARQARILDKYAINIATAYARKAGGTRDEWRAIMRDEGWYTAEEAVAAGLADRVGDALPAEDVVKSASHDIRIFSLFKNAPESAKRFFTASIQPDKAASIAPDKSADATQLVELAAGVTSLSSALLSAEGSNEALRSTNAALNDELAGLHTKQAEMQTVFDELLTQVNAVLNMPLPRKTADAYADGIATAAEKWPWLHEAIRSEIGKTKPTT